MLHGLHPATRLIEPRFVGVFCVWRSVTFSCLLLYTQISFFRYDRFPLPTEQNDMSDSRQNYRVTLASSNFDAMAAVDVKAYDEAHAIRLAESCLSKDFAPSLHHIELLA
jgi:hypothetical protein